MTTTTGIGGTATMAEPRQTTGPAAGAHRPGRPPRRPRPLVTAGAALGSFLGALALLAHQASSDGDPADAAADAAGHGRPVVVRIEEWRVVRRLRRPAAGTPGDGAAAAGGASGEGAAAADAGDPPSAPAPAPADGAPAPDPEPAPLVSRAS
jgi:hypothetical protein